MAALLEVLNVSKNFSGLRAVADVSFSVPKGAVFAIIGPNGAGKTTLFNLIAGVFAPNSGTISFGGARIDRLPSDEVCRRGIGRTFQLVRPFPALTVEENVTVGALLRDPDPPAAMRRAHDILRRLGLFDKRAHPAGALTLPDRKRLEVARALATEPELLLLDEVMAGLRPTETDRMVEIVRKLNREDGITILLIEHVMRAVMALAAHVVVVSYGVKIAEGTPQQISRDQAVLDVYLGDPEAA
jgi:branched-chain amino acid transport system ATP-binding protein